MIITEANVNDHRKYIQDWADGIYTKEKEFADKAMAQVDIKTEEITIRDGTKIELITYRPKTLES